jgi:hypothetical protein
MRNLTVPSALAAVLALAILACQRDAAAVPEKEPAKASEAMKTLPADIDPCAWITAEEAARLLGPLEGPPWRAGESDHPSPDKTGRACAYTVAASGNRTAGDEKIGVELVTEDATTTEAGFMMVTGQLSSDAGKGVAGDVMKALGNGQEVAGWDHVSRLPELFVGRLGAIAIRTGIYTDRVPTDSIQRLAALVRDRIPDLPIQTPARYADRGEGPDPCSLVTREEAEAVLGKLAFPPYRSNSRKSSLADPRGEGCSYYLGKHRVFTIDATWDQGKTIFGMSVGTTQKIFSTIGVDGAAADTLEGGWDQAGAGPAGALYFLKGDQMLEITYVTAGVDLAAAARLAKLAVSRLK